MVVILLVVILIFSVVNTLLILFGTLGGIEVRVKGKSYVLPTVFDGYKDTPHGYVVNDADTFGPVDILSAEDERKRESGQQDVEDVMSETLRKDPYLGGYKS